MVTLGPLQAHLPTRGPISLQGDVLSARALPLASGPFMSRGRSSLESAGTSSPQQTAHRSAADARKGLILGFVAVVAHIQPGGQVSDVVRSCSLPYCDLNFFELVLRAVAASDTGQQESADFSFISCITRC